MLCPRCHSDSCQRSRRRTLRDYTLGLASLRPWRCAICDLRFYAWRVSLRMILTAHCGRCGNFDIQRVSSKLVERWYMPLFRMMSVPAYRCAPCRERFFSVRAHNPIRSTESQAASAERASPELTGQASH